MIKQHVEECTTCDGYGWKWGTRCQQCEGTGGQTVIEGAPNGRVVRLPYRSNVTSEELVTIAGLRYPVNKHTGLIPRV